jgi:hypothetical protein
MNINLGELGRQRLNGRSALIKTGQDAPHRRLIKEDEVRALKKWQITPLLVPALLAVRLWQLLLRQLMLHSVKRRN